VAAVFFEVLSFNTYCHGAMSPYSSWHQI